MNPYWKKAYYDVTSKEDLEKWQEVATEIHYQNVSERIRKLVSINTSIPFDPEFCDDVMYESWGDPQEMEFCDEAAYEWEVKYGIANRIWESSMNQVLDEGVDCSGEPSLFINWQEFLKNGARAIM